jgi:hypothetical protein
MAIDHLTREKTQAVPAAPPARSVAAALMPILESGDHLSRADFERRYEAITDLK